MTASNCWDKSAHLKVGFWISARDYLESSNLKCGCVDSIHHLTPPLILSLLPTLDKQGLAVLQIYLSTTTPFASSTWILIVVERTSSLSLPRYSSGNSDPAQKWQYAKRLSSLARSVDFLAFVSQISIRNHTSGDHDECYDEQDGEARSP
jgi:hypothetical protein